MENDSFLMVSKSSELRIESIGGGGGGEEEKSVYGSLSLRKIEFHAARKQFNGFGNNSNNGSDFRIETLNPDPGFKRVNGLNHFQSSSSSSKKGDRSDFVENGLDPELSFRITFRKIGAGLENLGNTCFLNSVLQCLTYTEPLAAYLQSGKHQNSCHIAGFCALCAIQKHVSRALQSTGRSLIPKDLVSNLRCISRNFRNARQEDAHEYMVNLLESMHKCCLPSGVPSESPAAYEKSLVHKIFGGRLRSQVECQQCSYCSNKFDPFLDLSLEIVKADTLPVALRNFTAAELLDGGEKHYQCQKCKQKVRAKKRLTVHNVPNVLTIHLKRFHAHDPGRKVDKRVLFDRSLDMKPFVSGSYEGDLKYSLYGVLVHFGHSTHSGHYVCYVRTSSGIWHLLNDNEVRPVSERNVLDQKAYMLFYVRDRQNIAPKKPADVVRKENTKASVSSCITNSFFKQMSKEQVDNGSIGNGLLSANSTASVNQNNALNFSTSKEIPQKGALQQPLISECSLTKTNPTAEPSSKDQSKEISLNPDMGVCLSPSAPSMNRNGDAAKINNARVTIGVETSDCKKASSNCDDPQSTTIEKHVTSEPSEKVNLILNVGVDGSVEIPRLPPSDSMDQMSNEPSSGISQAGGFPNQSTVGNSPGDQSGDSDQRNKLAEPSNEDLHKEAPNCTPHKKLKKRSKYRISTMHFGIKIFRASISLRKKKKHKRRKHINLRTQNLIKEQVEGCSLSEVGPSTSKESISASLGAVHSQRKSAKSHSKCRDDSLMDYAVEECKKRNNQNGDAVVLDKQLKNSISITEVNQRDTSGLDCRESSRENTSEKGMMCILTRGLEERTVARWDGLELPRSQIVESSSMENHYIGYVPDEWDEEYDRGKRKKIRQNKHDFGGANPFQEFACKKTQFKKAKMDRSSSGNRPFRI